MEQTAGESGKGETEIRKKPIDEHSGKTGGTAQTANDAREKSRHSDSENDLESTQDKNPVPPDATRRP